MILQSTKNIPLTTPLAVLKPTSPAACTELERSVHTGRAQSDTGWGEAPRPHALRWRPGEDRGPAAEAASLPRLVASARTPSAGSSRALSTLSESHAPRASFTPPLSQTSRHCLPELPFCDRPPPMTQRRATSSSASCIYGSVTVPGLPHNLCRSRRAHLAPADQDVGPVLLVLVTSSVSVPVGRPRL